VARARESLFTLITRAGRSRPGATAPSGRPGTGDGEGKKRRGPPEERECDELWEHGVEKRVFVEKFVRLKVGLIKRDFLVRGEKGRCRNVGGGERCVDVGAHGERKIWSANVNRCVGGKQAIGGKESRGV
jgi:hypothetical protein